MARTAPESILRLYVYTLGGIYYLANPDERADVTNTALAVLNHRSRLDKARLLSRIYAGIFEHYYEKITVSAFPLPKIVRRIREKCRIENPKLLDTLASSGKGAILVSGHFGAVEYLPGLLTLSGYKVAIILRFKSTKTKVAQERRARRYDLLTIDANERGALQKGISAVRRGRFLITLCDEFSFWIPSSKSRFSIFGQRLPGDKTLDIMYQRARVPVITAFLLREGRGYRLKLHTIAEGRNPAPVSTKVWELLEEYILAYPEQWYQWNSVAHGLATYRLKIRRHAAV